MEEQKYYTPAPEDLRKGFVYERQDQVMPDIWRTNTINQWSKYYIAQSDLANNRVRVPYLTSDQIEAEGWQITNKGQPASSYIYNAEILDESNGEYSITYFSNIQTIQVFDFLRHTVFNGKCRCINDFRLICKLLGI